MKKILSLLIGLFFAFSSSAQSPKPSNDDFPQYYMKGKDTIGVIFTVAQAQKIDNDYELLLLLKQSKIQSDSLINAYITVIDLQGKQIAKLELKTSLLEDLNKIKDSEIENLKQQIAQYKKDKVLSDSIIVNDKELITSYKKESRKLKTQKYLFTGLGIAAAVVALVLLK